VVPIVMMMKPQKIGKWYLLPIAVTKACQRAAGITAFSMTFFCPRKNVRTEARRAAGFRSRFAGRPARTSRPKRRSVHANNARDTAKSAANTARFIDVA